MMNKGDIATTLNVLVLCITTIFCCNVYPANQGGRLVVVAAVKHKQFKDLYDYLQKHAHNFDPRYAGSLRTNGNSRDEHKNLHITLASTDPGYKNEEACKKALSSISGYLNDKIKINVNPKHLGFDSDKHVILSLKKDAGYDQLLKLQKKVVESLKKHGATGIHAKDPNHVTIGFAGSLSVKSYPHTIHAGSVTHARVYLWKGHGAQVYPPREEFYPKKEVRVYGGHDNRNANLHAKKNVHKKKDLKKKGTQGINNKSSNKKITSKGGQAHHKKKSVKKNKSSK